MKATGAITTAKDLRSAVEPVVDIKVTVSDIRNTVGPFTITSTITSEYNSHLHVTTAT